MITGRMASPNGNVAQTPFVQAACTVKRLRNIRKISVVRLLGMVAEILFSMGILGIGYLIAAVLGR